MRQPFPSLTVRAIVGVALVMMCLPLASAADEWSDTLYIKLPDNPKPFIFELGEADEAMGFTSVGGDFYAPHGQYCTGPCSDTKTTFTFTMTEGDKTTSDTVTVTIRPVGRRDLISISLNSDVGGDDTKGPGKETAHTTDLFTEFPHGFAVLAISDCGTKGSLSSCSPPVPEPQSWMFLGSGLLVVGGCLLRKVRV